jgi:hypothetical protein
MILWISVTMVYSLYRYVCDVKYISQLFTTIGLSSRQIVSCCFNQNTAVQCGLLSSFVYVYVAFGEMIFG